MTVMPGKPSLRTELLFNLAFLASAALLLGVGSLLAVQALAPDLTPGQAVLLILLGRRKINVNQLARSAEGDLAYAFGD